MLRATLWLAFFLLIVPAATAQLTAAPPAVEAPRASRVDIDFPGGSLGDYIELLRDICPTINIVATEKATEIPLQAVRLKNVNPENAIYIVDQLLGNQIDVDGRGGNDPIVVIRGREGPAAVVFTKIVSIRNLIAGENSVPVDQMLAVIEAALTLDESAVRPTPIIRIHKETGMLMVKAHELELQTIFNVIEELRSSHLEAHTTHRNDVQRDFEQGMVHMQHQLALSQRTAHEMQQQVAQLKDELTERELIIARLESQLANMQHESR